MIYGINFNGTEIPPGIKRKFAQRVKAAAHQPACPNKDQVSTSNALCQAYGCAMRWFELKGVGQNAEERQAMVIQASNGRRWIHVENRDTPAGVWYGIYTY